jgi:hypothetical protein
MNDAESYFALMDVMASCDMRAKLQVTTDFDYPVWMTKEQCIEKFIDNARKSWCPYEWSIQFLPSPDGEVLFSFPHNDFVLTREEYNDVCRRFDEAQREYFESLKSQEDEND